MSPDPGWYLQADPSNPQTWNQYVYGLNNPLINTDPTGKDCVTDNQDGSISTNTGDCANESEEAANREYYIDCDNCTSHAAGATLDAPTGSLYLTDADGKGIAGTTVQGFAAAQGVATSVSADPSTTSNQYNMSADELSTMLRLSGFTHSPLDDVLNLVTNTHPGVNYRQNKATCSLHVNVLPGTGVSGFPVQYQVHMDRYSPVIPGTGLPGPFLVEHAAGDVIPDTVNGGDGTQACAAAHP